MHLLDRFTLITRTRTAHIELYSGDITAIPPSERIDLLVISAFPEDYAPTPSSLIGALHARGIDVSSLALNPASDMREISACWVSRPLPPEHQPFEQIMCFEPLVRGSAPEVVGDLFRATISVLDPRKGAATVAMPLLATGDQRNPIENMLPPLLYEASQWISSGVPVERLMIFVRTEDKAALAREIFSTIANQLDISAPDLPVIHDIFISYSHKQAHEMDYFRNQLKTRLPEVQVFVDETNLETGIAWHPELFRSIDQSRIMVPLYSPDYMRSKMCRDEFNFAWGRWQQNKCEVFPVLLYSTDLLPNMGTLQYEDCAENDRSKVSRSIDRLVEKVAGTAFG
jgi:hypothetical protein